MNLFDKIKDKVSKLTKESAELARESAGKIGEKATVFTQVSRLKVDVKGLEKKLEDLLTELGGEFYHLMKTGKTDGLSEELQPTMAKIKDVEQQLAEKYEELQNAMKEMATKTIDKTKVQSLKKELEEGGGTIEQIVIQERASVLGKKLKDVTLPKEVLVGTILRGEEVIIPDGTYQFQLNDKVTLLGKKQDVEEALPLFSPPPESTEEKPEN